MKKTASLVALAAFLTMSLSASVAAQCAAHKAETQAGTTGADKCAAGAAASPELMQKFNKETKAFQEQLIDKQASLKKEFLKDDPDPEAIATIKKSIIDIEKEMQKVAKKIGMKNWACTCHMSQGNGCGGEMSGCGKK